MLWRSIDGDSIVMFLKTVSGLWVTVKIARTAGVDQVMTVLSAQKVGDVCGPKWVYESSRNREFTRTQNMLSLWIQVPS